MSVSPTEGTTPRPSGRRSPILSVDKSRSKHGSWMDSRLRSRGLFRLRRITEKGTRFVGPPELPCRLRP